MSSNGIEKEIVFLPGYNKNTTDLDAEGHWVTGDKIRFRYGKAEKIGGWVSEPVVQASASSSVFTGVARDIRVWSKNDEKEEYIAVGTTEKVEFANKGYIWDMTPIRAISTATNPFNTSAGSTDLTCSVAAHGAQAGDWVVVASATASLTNIDRLEYTYKITSVPGANSFIVSTATAATSTLSAAGGAATFSFLLPIGRRSNGFAYGYGAGPYGEETYGTPRTTGVDVELRQWQLENWGEDLLANPRGGKVYWWDADVSVLASANDPDRSEIRLQVVTAAPTTNNFILVSQPSRHLVSFGCENVSSGEFDPMNVRWSQSENFNIWDPTVSVFGGNTSGEQRLAGSGEIISAIQTKNEIVIFTDSDVHTMRYIGDPFWFGFDKLGSNTGIAGPHAAVDVNGVVYWMGQSSFYAYDGRIRVLPSSLHKTIFNIDDEESINFDQKEKVYTGVNAEFNEITWFYPSRDSTNIDRYVTYNYLDNVWYDGTIDRTVWKDRGILDKPVAVDSDGVLYSHEEGKDDDAQALPFTLESGWIDLADGEEFVFIDKFIPDYMQIPSGKTIYLTIKYKKYPQDVEEFEKGPYPITESTRKVNFRVRGRVVKLIYSGTANGVDMQVGAPRIQMKPDGRR